MNFVMGNFRTPVVVRIPDPQTERVLPGDAHVDRGRRAEALRDIGQARAVVRFSKRADLAGAAGGVAKCVCGARRDT